MSLHFTLCTALYTFDLTFHTQHFTLPPHSTLHTSHSTLLHSTLYTFTQHSILHFFYTPAPYTLNLTQHTLHLTLYTPHLHSIYTFRFTLDTPHSTRHSTLYIRTIHFTLHAVHFALYTPHSTLYTPHSTLPTLHCIRYTSHFRLGPLHLLMFKNYEIRFFYLSITAGVQCTYRGGLGTVRYVGTCLWVWVYGM